VRVAQLETEIDFPPALIETWVALQKHFGCSSEAGNNISSLILNFDMDENYVYRINVGLSEKVMSSEEAFSRVFHEIESTVRCTHTWERSSILTPSRHSQSTTT
jgi:hypothetical protein